MRRFVDIAVAVLALALLSPVLLLIMLAVFLSSPGNPFYGGWRAGQDGRNFKMWKFRTMVKDASKMGPITGKNDPRVTWIGRFIRKGSIDELPQLWCVLKGEMSLVGPRPPVPSEVAEYTLADRRRLDGAFVAEAAVDDQACKKAADHGGHHEHHECTLHLNSCPGFCPERLAFLARIAGMLGVSEV